MAAAEHHRDAGRGETMSEFGGGGAVALIDGARRTAIDANRSDLPFGINRLRHRAPPPVAARRGQGVAVSGSREPVEIKRAAGDRLCQAASIIHLLPAEAAGA